MNRQPGQHTRAARTDGPCSKTHGRVRRSEPRPSARYLTLHRRGDFLAVDEERLVGAVDLVHHVELEDVGRRGIGVHRHEHLVGQRQRLESNRHVRALAGRDVLQPDTRTRSALVVEVHDDPRTGGSSRASDEQRVLRAGLVGDLDRSGTGLGGNAEVAHCDDLRELLAAHEVRTVGAHLLVHHVEVELVGLAAVGVHRDDHLRRREVLELDLHVRALALVDVGRVPRACRACRCRRRARRPRRRPERRPCRPRARPRRPGSRRDRSAPSRPRRRSPRPSGPSARRTAELVHPAAASSASGASDERHLRECSLHVSVPLSMQAAARRRKGSGRAWSGRWVPRPSPSRACWA